MFHLLWLRGQIRDFKNKKLDTQPGCVQGWCCLLRVPLIQWSRVIVKHTQWVVFALLSSDTLPLRFLCEPIKKAVCFTMNWPTVCWRIWLAGVRQSNTLHIVMRQAHCSNRFTPFKWYVYCIYRMQIPFPIFDKSLPKNSCLYKCLYFIFYVLLYKLYG